ncbi:toxin-activating lysine-acyltransferase [Pseudooceanicola sp.]|uniref:toxin-activating lysine-acyltransferase n=1 Tax=Pseudooceanicola sp. TaxID=1914328 RepID=UPI00405A362B
MADKAASESVPADALNGAGHTAPEPDQTPGEEATLSPEMVEKLSDIRGKLQTSIAQVVIALSISPRYAYMPLKDLGEMVIEPLMRDRIALATPKEETAAPLQKDTLTGIAIWATVSEEVEAKIRDQIAAGVFPIRLAPRDWTSGDRLWLLDVIAPTKDAATAVLRNFTGYVGKKSMHLHPIVGRVVDKSILERMGASSEIRPATGVDPVDSPADS